MRILILPLLGMGNYTRDSNFRVFTDIIKFMGDKPIHWYFVVPDLNIEEKYKRKNVTYIPVDMKLDLKNFYGQVGRIPDEVYNMFSRRNPKYPIDAIFTSRTSACATLPLVLGDKRLDTDIPIHIFEPLARINNYRGNDSRKAIVFGYANGRTWFLNEDEKEKSMNEVAKYLSPSLYRETRKRSYVQGLPINIDRLDKVCNNKKYQKFTIFWGARVSGEKNPQEMAIAIEKMRSSGRDFNFIMTTPHTTSMMVGRVLKKAKGAIERVCQGCDIDIFFEKVSKSHMFICTSKVEGFPTGFMEQLYITNGMGIFPARDWAIKLLPKEFPFMYKGEAEMHTLIRWIFNNYEEALTKVGWVRGWIKENYAGEVIANKFYEKLNETIETKVAVYKGFSKLVDGVLVELGTEFNWMGLMKCIERVSNSWDTKTVARLGLNTKYDIHKYILSKGYVDDTNMEYPTYHKK